MQEAFLRGQMIFGEAAPKILASSKVLIVGIGGVGGYAAEAIARSGVGEIILADHDTVGASNINRQIIALSSTVGRPKAEVMAERIRDINPDCHVTALFERYEEATRDQFFGFSPDYIIDAIDLVKHKLDLIETALNRNIPIISALGTGNKLDASLLRISDISATENCPLARVVRRELRARGIYHHRVVWSPEKKRTAEQLEAPPEGRRSIPGSVVWVPATAGLMMAGEVVMDLLRRKGCEF